MWCVLLCCSRELKFPEFGLTQNTLNIEHCERNTPSLYLATATRGGVKFWRVAGNSLPLALSHAELWRAQSKHILPSVQLRCLEKGVILLHENKEKNTLRVIQTHSHLWVKPPKFAHRTDMKKAPQPPTQ